MVLQSRNPSLAEMFQEFSEHHATPTLPDDSNSHSARTTGPEAIETKKMKNLTTCQDSPTLSIPSVRSPETVVNPSEIESAIRTESPVSPVLHVAAPSSVALDDSSDQMAMYYNRRNMSDESGTSAILQRYAKD